MWVLADVYQFALRGKRACLAGFMLIYAGLVFGFGWDDEEDQLVLQRLGTDSGACGGAKPVDSGCRQLTSLRVRGSP